MISVLRILPCILHLALPSLCAWLSTAVLVFDIRIFCSVCVCVCVCVIIIFIISGFGI